MPTYDEYRALVEGISAEQKLAILGPETKCVLPVIQGFALLIQKLVEERGAPQMPPDFGEWCRRIADAAQELTDLIDALINPKHRDILHAEWEEQKRAQAGSFWKEEQAELLELQAYPSFIVAVKQTASKLGWSLPEDLDITNSFYPSVMSAFSTPERRVNIQAVLTKHHLRPLGYAVTLSELAADELNVKGRGHEGSTKSLDKVVLVLCRWLIEKWELERIRLEHEWMSSGVILWH